LRDCAIVFAVREVIVDALESFRRLLTLSCDIIFAILPTLTLEFFRLAGIVSLLDDDVNSSPTPLAEDEMLECAGGGLGNEFNRLEVAFKPSNVTICHISAGKFFMLLLCTSMNLRAVIVPISFGRACRELLAQ
jgi:hypothetical protein